MALIRPSRARRRLFWLMTACFVMYALFTLSFHIEPASEGFHEFNKCPACFGDGFCPHLRDVKLVGWYSRRALRAFNVKNVFMGELNGTRVVLKKLAHDKEFAKIDRQWCRNRRCSVAQAVQKAVDRAETVEGALMGLMAVVKKQQDMTACPSSRLVRRVLSMMTFTTNMIAKRRGALRPADVFAYTVTVNPEPLILQAFPRMDDWPFPSFLGSCGRTVVESFEGERLSTFERARWIVRANISLQLLNMADLMTDNPTQFALYMTDVSMDNFVVSRDGHVTLVDVENIIVVDRIQVVKERREGWRNRLEHREEMCHDCLSFSMEDLCSHETSDHNYYAVCSGLLAPRAFYSSHGGLLHGIPRAADQKHNLTALLAACDQPSATQNRFSAANQLRFALEKVVLEAHSSKAAQDALTKWTPQSS
ncbi:divergent protein kinase domain 2A [Haemaphysalis longicornis]